MRYSTEFHPQTQGIVERMNAVIGKMLRCTIYEMNEVREWKRLFPMIELAINSSVNRSTGYTPFFLNYGFDPVVPVDLIKGNERVQNAQILNFSDKDYHVILWNRGIPRRIPPPPPRIPTFLDCPVNLPCSPIAKMLPSCSSWGPDRRAWPTQRMARDTKRRPRHEALQQLPTNPAGTTQASNNPPAPIYSLRKPST